MTTVTNYMLRKKIAEINRELSTFPISRGTATETSTGTSSEVSVYVEKIAKVEGDYMITANGTKAKLYCPMPCLYWKATGTPDSKGVITLKKQLEGLFINDNKNTYCLGVLGASDEFEVRFHTGENEVRINKNWLNLKANHLIQNGMEIK